MSRAADEKAERLAQALRANLARRKAQARGQVVETPEDQRASASDPSDVAAPAA